MNQKVKCNICKEIRDITRKKTTPKDYSFYCLNCHKEVPQDLDFREINDYLND